MTLSSIHISNLNSILKNIKSEIMADFTQTNQHSIVITMNKVVSLLDLQTIEKYVKNLEHNDSEDIKLPCLSQLKSYLKIIGIPYLMENTNTSINSSFVKIILKSNHIFNNMLIALKP